MILEVDEVGYADAAAALRAGNRAGAEVLDDLLAGLAGTGRMAGDDASAYDFAAAYDEAAGEAVAGLADVTTAFATLGRLTERSDAEHRRSEARAIMPGAIVDAGCVDVPAGAYLAPLPVRPPTALGGDPPTLTPEENWILDHVEGFVWPDGDVERLRRAGAHWRSTAGRLDGLAASCDVAADALLTQRSPEIPLAVAAAEDLRSSIGDLASHCHALGQQCDAYADGVEATHAAVRALLQEILRFVVEGLVVAAVLGAVTAGVGAAGGTAAIVARIALQAPRFAALLRTLQSLTASVAASLQTTRAALSATRARLTRFLRVPVRGQRGAFVPLVPRPRWSPGWLAKHEHSGGHTLTEHVGKSADDLSRRTASGQVLRASSFESQAAAESYIERTLTRQQGAIDDWLKSGDPKESFDAAFGEVTGLTLRRGEDAADATGLRVVLVRDLDMSEGFRVLTAFPTP